MSIDYTDHIGKADTKVNHQKLLQIACREAYNAAKAMAGHTETIVPGQSRLVRFEAAREYTPDELAKAESVKRLFGAIYLREQKKMPSFDELHDALEELSDVPVKRGHANHAGEPFHYRTNHPFRSLMNTMDRQTDVWHEVLNGHGNGRAH